MNTEADAESRRLTTDTEWELSDYAFNKITEIFFVPEIDLFANRINTKCQNFISWQTDPFAWAVDAFTVPWGSLRFYAFPPFAMIPRVLQKIVADKATGILVVPNWPTQAWFPLFNSLLIKDVILFKPNLRLLSSFDRSTHMLWESLSLVAGVLPGRAG